MKFELARLATYDEASIIAEIHRVANLVPTPLELTTGRFDEHSKVSSSAVRRRFGGWHKALHAAGFADRYSGRTVSAKMKVQPARNMTDQQLIAELQRVALQLKSDVLTQPDFNSSSEISSSAVSRRLGSWNKALRAAGLKPVNMGRRYTEEDYFENLLTVWTHLGRQPKYAEMDSPPSTITSGGYEKRWGSWTKALVAFIERMNSVPDPYQQAPMPVKREVAEAPHQVPRLEDKHKIPLGLRYEVLKRDDFRCVKCGRSPALAPGLELHVDHVQPFSKEGKTIALNLQTLCKDCNLGKGNR